MYIRSSECMFSSPGPDMGSGYGGAAGRKRETCTYPVAFLVADGETSASRRQLVLIDRHSALYRACWKRGQEGCQCCGVFVLDNFSNYLVVLSIKKKKKNKPKIR